MYLSTATQSRHLVFVVDWIDVCKKNDENRISVFIDDDKAFCNFNISLNFFFFYVIL